MLRRAVLLLSLHLGHRLVSFPNHTVAVAVTFNFDRQFFSLKSPEGQTHTQRVVAPPLQPKVHDIFSYRPKRPWSAPII